MRILIPAICLLLLQSAFAQKVVDVSKNDVQVGSNTFFVSGGQPFVTAKFVNLVAGTPYFKDEWMKGIVLDKNNHSYKNINLKIDLLDKNVHYQNADGKEFIATTPVKEVVLTDASDSSYRFVHSSGFEPSVNGVKNGWYLLLRAGAASLYKIFIKDLSETTPYGSSTVEQRIITTERYLIYYNNTFLEVKKIGEVPNVLAGKKAELNAFLKKEENLKGTTDERFIRLIEYYNSLPTEQK